MNVIRHDHKIGKDIAIAVEVPQTRGDDLCQLGAPQDASAVSGIQLVVPTFGESPMEFALEHGCQGGKLRSPMRVIGIDALLPQPAVTVGAPLRQDRRGDGIIGSPGNERDRAGLRPMGQTALRNRDRRVTIEQVNRQRLGHARIVAVTLRVTSRGSDGSRHAPRDEPGTSRGA
jgi:hypothetical protein